MPVSRLISLNPNSGAFVPIAASIAARAVEVVEDGSVAAQGLEVQFPADDYTTTDQYGPGIAVELTGAGRDGLAGLPAQNSTNGVSAFNYRAADVYCQARSATATATKVRVWEMEANAQ